MLTTIYRGVLGFAAAAATYALAVIGLQSSSDAALGVIALVAFVGLFVAPIVTVLAVLYQAGQNR